MKKVSLSFALLAASSGYSLHLYGQTVYSQWASPSGHVSTSRTPNFLCTSLTCPTISNEKNTVDNSLTNYATVDFPVVSVASSVTFTMDLSATVTSGYPGGVFLLSATNLAALSILPSFKVELLNGTTVVGSQTYSSFLNLSLFSTEGLSLCASPAAAYNKVRLTISSPIGVAAPMQFRIYYAYGNSPGQCVDAILPIDLVSFELERLRECNVKVQWASAHESNSNYFAVQRQINNTDRWEDIGKVKAAEFSDRLQNYSYVDEAVPKGQIAYRLVEYDMDGSAKVYQVRTIAMNCDRKRNELYPTIVQSGKNVMLTGISKPASVTVSDVYGKVRYPANFLAGDELCISTAGLTGGVYFLRVQHDNEVSHFKFIVQ